MNKLATKNKSTTSSYLQGKNHTYKKLYCKLNNIDTVIMDDDKIGFFSCNNIYNGNKYLKNIIIDLNNPGNHVSIDADGLMNIENISFLNYPKLEGITIPMEILNKDFSFSIFIILKNANIRKINLIYNEKNEEIIIDENVSWYSIKNKNSELKIKIGYKNEDKKTITYDMFGDKDIFYDKYSIENNKENNIDLRDYTNVDMIEFNNKNILDTFILTPELIKKKDLKTFKNIVTEKLIILDDNEMILNPKKLELHNVKVDIISKRSNFGNNLNNIIFIEQMNDGNKTYIYLNEDNKLKIINEEKLKNNSIIDKYKFIKKEGNVGVIIKYKKDLKFDLIINNKHFHINKMFINWYLNNTTLYSKLIIPREYKLLRNGLENIYDYGKDNYKKINEYIFDTLLEQITEEGMLDNFNKTYKDYQYYIKHIKDLINKGYSYKSLVYLHKNSFDNITGIKGCYRTIEDIELINNINDISKKLIKRK